MSKYETLIVESLHNYIENLKNKKSENDSVITIIGSFEDEETIVLILKIIQFMKLREYYDNNNESLTQFNQKSFYSERKSNFQKKYMLKFILFPISRKENYNYALLNRIDKILQDFIISLSFFHSQGGRELTIDQLKNDPILVPLWKLQGQVRTYLNIRYKSIFHKIERPESYSDKQWKYIVNEFLFGKDFADYLTEFDSFPIIKINEMEYNGIPFPLNTNSFISLIVEDLF